MLNRLALLLTAALLTLPAAQAQTHAVSGAEVLKLTQQYLAVAPKRYITSPGHAAAEQFIKDHFKPEAAKGNFITDSFSAHTPAGQLNMTNYIVKFPSTNAARASGIIVLATHYETNYWLKDINFVGANDGACTTALLIAIGQYLRTHPPSGYSVWLLFDDGEESVGKEWTDSDSLYGTRHLRAKWAREGVLSNIKAFLLADMIGAKDLNIDFDEQSTPWLRDLLRTAAKDTGHTGYIYKRQVPGLSDDHIPFKQAGVPVLDLIDINYGPPTQEHPEGGYHHTEKDTIDKLSAGSLQVSADLFLELIKLIDQK